MTTVLLIGEKTSQMKKFRESLFSSSQSSTNKEANMIYTYHGNWNGSKDHYNLILLPLTGHISNIDTPNAYGWGKVSPITIVQDPNALKINYNSTYRRIIQNYAKQVDELWIATDPDSEGDNIGFEAFSLAIKANPLLKSNIRRIWNSSLTIHEIKRAVAEAEKKNFGWDTNLALSVQGRRLTDAWLGFAGTRELTEAARKVKPIKVISAGRVQLPTLKMIVDRDLEHENHIPQDLWTIQANLQKKNSKEVFTAKHVASPLREEMKAIDIYNRVKGEKEAYIQKIEKKIIEKRPPIPLNTTAAISLISRLYKLKADIALNILSELYLEGLISYPRTENSFFKTDFPHNDILVKLRSHPLFNNFIRSDENNIIRTNGKKKGVEDHDPIHPTGELPKDSSGSKIGELHTKVWETLTRYYVSLFMQDLVTEKTKIESMIKKDLFITEGTVLINKGWTEVCPWVEQDEMLLPQLKENEVVDILEIKNVKTKTRPKPRWREYTVIKQMERLNLGTKSSRAEILKVLSTRKYVIRTNRNELVSTDIGRTLIKILEPIWPDIVTANFTRHVEQQMDLVAQGNKLYEDLIKQLRSEYIVAHQELIKNISQFQITLKSINSDLFDTFSKKSQFKKNVNDLTTILTSKNQTSSKKGKVCPKCKIGNLIIRTNISTNEKFFGCSSYPQCKYTAPATKSNQKRNIKKNTSLELNSRVPLDSQPEKCQRCSEGYQIIRLNKATGSKFYGCSQYPRCTWTKPIK